jgi:FKBP-type peptidyl-prolyl cis-trans isomerase
MKNKTILYFLIVLVVVIVLVFITINKKEEPATPVVGTEQNMPSTQQVQGVKITILKEGTGDVAKSGDTVAMNYTGKLVDGTVFDSNVDPKFGHVQPFIFTLGAGQVIKGWDVGVAGMKVGEKRTLEIAPDFAYGSAGAGGVIPPNAALSFEVELLAIKK